MMDDVVQGLQVPLALIGQFLGDGPSPPHPGPDLASMDKLVAKYSKVKLTPHTKKRVRRSHSGTRWGARVDGVRARSLAPPERTLAQILLTIAVLNLGVAPVLVLQILLGG